MAKRLEDFTWKVQERITLLGPALDGTVERTDDVPLRHTRLYYSLRDELDEDEWDDVVEWAAERRNLDLKFLAEIGEQYAAEMNLPPYQ